MSRPAVASTSDADIDRLVYLISHHFGPEDAYANRQAVENVAGSILSRDEEGAIIAYLLYEDDGTTFHGVRSGVQSDWRGQGLGLQLYKTMIKFAKRKKRVYQTYTSWDNVASINGHVRAGMRITRIAGDRFVHLST